MMLYFWWDLLEWRTCEVTPHSCERRFYLWVFVWEGLATVALAAVLVLRNRLARPEVATIWVLAAITAAFAGVVAWKRLFFERTSAA